MDIFSLYSHFQSVIRNLRTRKSALLLHILWLHYFCHLWTNEQWAYHGHNQTPKQIWMESFTTKVNSCKRLSYCCKAHQLRLLRGYWLRLCIYPAGNYIFKVNNLNTCSKLTINTPERRHYRRSGVFIVNFEHISHFVLLFLLLTLSR